MDQKHGRGRSEVAVLPELSLCQKTLLVFLKPGRRQQVDPIRIMKGLFLFAKECPRDWLPPEGRYEFVAKER